MSTILLLSTLSFAVYSEYPELNLFFFTKLFEGEIIFKINNIFGTVIIFSFETTITYTVQGELKHHSFADFRKEMQFCTCSEFDLQSMHTCRISRGNIIPKQMVFTM